MPPYSLGPESDGPTLAGLPVVVTGATGFIGLALVQALCAGGAVVTTLHRTGHGVRSIEALGARPLRVHLDPGPGLVQALSGQRVLFHFAYDVRAGAAANLRAFDAVHAAAEAAHVGRIVHAGSAVVYDTWPEGRIDESAPCDGPVNDAYRSTKREMDRRLLSGTRPAAILQPTIVYGPRSTLWIDQPMAAMRAGGVVLPEPAGTCPAVYVEDVVQAALRAALLPDLGRERFVISGADNPGWVTYWEAIRDLAGSGEIVREPLEELRTRLGPPPDSGAPAPPSLAARVSATARQAIGHDRFERLVAGARRLRGRTGPVRPDHAALALFAANPVVCTENAAARLGYVPAFSFAEGIRACRSALGR